MKKRLLLGPVFCGGLLGLVLVGAVPFHSPYKGLYEGSFVGTNVQGKWSARVNDDGTVGSVTVSIPEHPTVSTRGGQVVPGDGIHVTAVPFEITLNPQGIPTSFDITGSAAGVFTRYPYRPSGTWQVKGTGTEMNPGAHLEDAGSWKGEWVSP